MSNTRPKTIILRDVTLREGLDVPGVEKRLTFPKRLKLGQALYELGIREFDIVHPGRVNGTSIRLAGELKRLYGKKIVVHGAAYAHNSNLQQELDLMRPVVDEVDLVMPVIPERPPHGEKEKISCAVRGLELLRKMGWRGGIGFANATQCKRTFLFDIAEAVQRANAEKIIIYDSVGLLDPEEAYALVREMRERVRGMSILFHCHNDLGLAVANSVLAVYGGAYAVDVSMNGLGDRAGNAALEQLATIFHIKKIRTGIQLEKLRRVSDLTERLCGIKKAVNHPITGDPRILFSHISPKHIPDKKSFEILPKQLRVF